jgi:biofilm PGA synthesis N-glycosyltransferase PgaC
MYLSVKLKFTIALVFAFAWMGGSVWFSMPWYQDLSNVIGPFFAYFFITFIAIIPGFMNAFVAMALLLNKRPSVLTEQAYPPVTILIAAFNEADSIASSLRSLFLWDYQVYCESNA